MTKTPSPGEWLRLQRGRAAAADTPTPPTCNGEDALDSQVERFLQLHGVKYAPKSLIPMAMIDEATSRANQARDVPILPESVDRFAQAIKAGEYLPPIVVFPNGNKVTIVDGNNRHAGHKKAGSVTVPGFVIAEDTPSETIALLTVASNNGHGVTPDLKWRKRQAAYLVSVGFSGEKACDAAGVSKSQLADYTALLRADARGKRMHVSSFSSLPESARINLGRIALDNAFFTACRLAIDTSMSSEDTRILLKDIKVLGTEADQLAFLARMSDERKLEAKAKAATGGTGRISSPKQSLITAIGKIMHMDPTDLARQVLTEDDRRLLIRRCDEAGEKLIELQIALGNKTVMADAV